MGGAVVGGHDVQLAVVPGGQVADQRLVPRVLGRQAVVDVQLRPLNDHRGGPGRRRSGPHDVRVPTQVVEDAARRHPGAGGSRLPARRARPVRSRSEASGRAPAAQEPARTGRSRRSPRRAGSGSGRRAPCAHNHGLRTSGGSTAVAAIAATARTAPVTCCATRARTRRRPRPSRLPRHRRRPRDDAPRDGLVRQPHQRRSEVVPVHHQLSPSRSTWTSRSPAGASKARSSATALAFWLLTVPTVTPSSSAVCASLRSSRWRSTTTARRRGGSVSRAAIRTWRTATAGARSAADGSAGSSRSARDTSRRPGRRRHRPRNRVHDAAARVGVRVREPEPRHVEADQGVLGQVLRQAGVPGHGGTRCAPACAEDATANSYVPVSAPACALLHPVGPASTVAGRESTTPRKVVGATRARAGIRRVTLPAGTVGA